ncbi:MAG: hypothetical protein HY040_27050 [Planctomycetes bacterium]|nr:hypothetical protein [Planctomycetota bacterium]
MRSFVQIEPRYRELLGRLSMTCADDFLRLQGTILGGHPDRHVMQITLGSDGSAPRAFLKREHRVRWKHRLENYVGGFGWTSKSVREARTLLELARMNIGCPEVMAFGESRGRAFVLLREADGFDDLRVVLQTLKSGRERRRLARALGRDLALIHASEFEHGDLFSKHLLVAPGNEDWRFCLLDWQRSHRRGAPSWQARRRDLAALDATLDESLASERERLAFIGAYLGDAPVAYAPGSPSASLFIESIRNSSQRLQRQRRVREMRRPPSNRGLQNLIWLDGEALCVTREFLNELGGVVPEWLREIARATASDGVQTLEVSLGNGRRGVCVRRRQRRPLKWLFAWAARRSFPAPEFEKVSLWFRQQRLAIRAPRVLAVGHHSPKPWLTYSFLLSERVGLEDSTHPTVQGVAA